MVIFKNYLNRVKLSINLIHMLKFSASIFSRRVKGQVLSRAGRGCTHEWTAFFQPSRFLTILLSSTPFSTPLSEVCYPVPPGSSSLSLLPSIPPSITALDVPPPRTRCLFFITSTIPSGSNPQISHTLALIHSLVFFSFHDTPRILL